MKRWKIRPEGSNWGDFGEDDQKGRLNFITPDVVLRAVAEVRTGKQFCLSLPLDLPGKNVLNPRRFPPQFAYSMRGEDPVFNYPMERINPGQTDVINDDKVTISTQYSTQWDSLAHFGALFDSLGDGQRAVVYYNGYRGGEHVRGPFDYLDSRKPQPGPYGALALGIENVAETCVQSRGVMVDLLTHFGPTWQAIGYEQLMRVMELDKVTLEKGDILCLRSGFDDVLISYKGNPPEGISAQTCAGLDGSDERLLRWIDESGLVAIASDNEGVEALPALRHGKSGTRVPLHEHCLFKLGIPLGEMFFFKELADWLRANERSAFLLTAPPLRLPTAVGSPVMPVATV